MLVELTDGLAGENFSWPPGQQIEMDPEDALRLIRKGVAMRVEEEPAPQQAPPKASKAAK